VKIRNTGKWELRLLTRSQVYHLATGAVADLPDDAEDVHVSAIVDPERFAAEEKLELVRRLLGTADDEEQHADRGR
jgi:hypothetical protein